MDRLQAMRVFERVVDEGGFAAAARALDMSAPVVTRLIAELEAHLGTRLMQRSTRRLSLTEAGQAYLSRVRHILQDVDEAEAVASTNTTELAGVLRLHAPPALASQGLAPLLTGFRRLYPKIRFDIDVETVRDTPYENYDITLIATGQNFDADVVARKVLEADTVLVAAPEYLARFGTPQTPAELDQHDFLWFCSLDERPRAMRMWRSGEPTEVVEVTPRTALVTNHTDTVLRAVLDGAGLCSMTVNLAAPYLARGELVRVLPAWVHDKRVVVYAVLPSRKFLPQRTRVFLDYLIEEASKVQEGVAVEQAVATAKQLAE
jgi:DNA-binding transcriptional LysR family regulator